MLITLLKEPIVLRQYLLVVCLVFVSVAALGQNDELTVRKELERAYEKLNLANKRGALKAVLAMKTADFHTVLPDGTVNDFQTMKQYSERFMKNNSAGLEIKITIQKLAVSMTNGKPP